MHNVFMDEVSLQFHIEENDYFGTLATVLDLVSQVLRKKGQQRNAETLRQGKPHQRCMRLRTRSSERANPTGKVKHWPQTHGTVS
jgi:hypothetical protein